MLCFVNIISRYDRQMEPFIGCKALKNKIVEVMFTKNNTKCSKRDEKCKILKLTGGRFEKSKSKD